MRTMKKAIWHDQTCDLMNNIVWATEGSTTPQFLLDTNRVCYRCDGPAIC